MNRPHKAWCIINISSEISLILALAFSACDQIAIKDSVSKTFMKVTMLDQVVIRPQSLSVAAANTIVTYAG